MTVCSNNRPNFEFLDQDIKNAVKNKKLLSMEIEFSQRCNFRCPYCYTPEESYFEDELTCEEIKKTILQAKDLGARKIIVLGGEPTLYPHLIEMLHFIKNLDLEIEIFTNGSGMTSELAAELFEKKARVVQKMNSFDSKVQDQLTNIKGSAKMIQHSLNLLIEAGYTKNDSFLAVSTIICQQNLSELPDMWVWLRDRNISPYFEIITPQGKAKKNRWLEVSSAQILSLFEIVADIDRTRYGTHWTPQPPLVGNKCMRHQFSCLVTSKGHVFPCVGITISIGNIRNQPLADIIRNSEVLDQLKDYRNTIKGSCRSCEKANHCYGCRGAAFQLTGDYLASDPTCWLNEKQLFETINES